MTRPSSLDSGRSKTPTSFETELVVRGPLPEASPSPSKNSPRNPSNRLWVQEQQRRIFLHHLSQWSLNHDSSPYFHGKIILLPQDSRAQEEIGLGKSVSCILTDATSTNVRRKIVIRVFPPQADKANRRRQSGRQRRYNSVDAEVTDAQPQEEPINIAQYDERGQPPREHRSTSSRYYKLVVRCGAGWMSAREYLSKLYFTQVGARKAVSSSNLAKQTLDSALKHRSQVIGSPLLSKETVTIRPLFHHFRHLPPELQEMILNTAAGLSRTYNLCYDTSFFPKPATNSPSPISLSTMFRISKDLNKHLLPYIYHSTDFHFGLTRFTNFLWQSGPVNRPEIRRLTFHFGKLALLHCIRWLAPDPVFELLEPPVVTSPPALQYFWRCQIQDLAREVNLLTLTINLRGVPIEDTSMVLRILKSAFGSIERVLFVETDKYGNSRRIDSDDERLGELKKELTWRELCAGYFERHRRHQYFSKWDLMHLKTEHLDALMDVNKEYFDQ